MIAALEKIVDILLQPFLMKEIDFLNYFAF